MQAGRRKCSAGPISPHELDLNCFDERNDVVPELRVVRIMSKLGKGVKNKIEKSM